MGKNLKSELNKPLHAPGLCILLCFFLFFPGSVSAQNNVCGQSSLDDEVSITADINSEERTASFDVTLNSPPFTNSNVNSFSVIGNSTQQISDSLNVEGVEFTYPDSVSDFSVTVEVDIDCSENQGVIKTKDYSFSDNSDDPELEDINYEYTVDGENNVDLDVTSPTDNQYSYQWYIDKDAESGTSDLNGQNVSFSASDYAPDELEIDVLLQIRDSEGNSLGAQTKTIPTVDGESEDSSDDDNDGNGDEDENSDGNNDGNVGDGDGIPPSDGLVNCGRQTEVVTIDGSTTTRLVNPCGYDDLINLVSRMIQWLIGILVLVATLLFTYAGFLYLGADGNSNQAEDAKKIFTNVAVGFFLVLVSVLLVTTLVTMFTSSSWEQNWMNVLPLPEMSIKIDDLPVRDNFYT